MRLLAQLVRGEMIAFAVSGRGGGVSVGGQVVQLRDSIVYALWHNVLPFPKMRAVPTGAAPYYGSLPPLRQSPSLSVLEKAAQLDALNPCPTQDKLLRETYED